MVSKREITSQLKKIGFNHKGWGKSGVSELPNIILPDEEIYECVNGLYEGGFALLIATNIRVLLVDKKPLGFLTVEDMRFDMINEMDYNHRLMGAEIGISSGGKNLRFRSYNKIKLRKLISHVQHCMAKAKQQQSTHQDDQVSHLQQINMQLQAYLASQQQYQMQVQQLATGKSSVDDNAKLPDPPKPSNELADYLYAQSLLSQHLQNNQSDSNAMAGSPTATPLDITSLSDDTKVDKAVEQTFDSASLKAQADIYNEGIKEIFGAQSDRQQPINSSQGNVDPIEVAYSKLPMATRSRKFSQQLNTESATT